MFENRPLQANDKRDLERAGLRVGQSDIEGPHDIYSCVHHKLRTVVCTLQYDHRMRHSAGQCTLAAQLFDTYYSTMYLLSAQL